MTFSLAGILACAPSTADNGLCTASFQTQVDADSETLSAVNDEYAQSFKTPGAVSAPVSVELKLNAVGTPTGTLIVKIEKDSSGQPDGVTLVTGTMDASKIKSTGAAFYNFPLATVPTLLAKTLYWIRFKGAPGSNLSASNSIQWMGNNTNAYADGSATYSSNGGTSWNVGPVGASRDLIFTVGATQLSCH